MTESRQVWRRLPSWRLVLSADNPFWQLELRRVARRGDRGAFWPPALLILSALAFWFGLESRLAEWPPYLSIWHLLLAWHAAILAAAVAVPGWRMLNDIAAEENATELRVTPLPPLLAVLARSVAPLSQGLRAALSALPVYLCLNLLPGPDGPSLVGIYLLSALVLVLALFLAATGGAAAARTRQATIDDWTDFVFNVRTLAATFLNPAWIFLLVLLLVRRGPELADWLGGLDAWFHTPLPGALLLLPVLLWAWRQAAGLATELDGETPALAWRVVAGFAAAYVVFVLVVVGFNWTNGIESFAVADWWDLPADRANTARLLLALLLLGGVPLPLFATYADALSTGLRRGSDSALRRPRFRACLSAVAWGLLAAVVPWLVYGTCLALGGWPSGEAGVGFLRRSALLWFGAAGVTSGFLVLLLLTAGYRRAVREPLALLLVLPPLLGPFVARGSAPLARLLAVTSPFTGLAWLPPDAGTGLGMTGEIPLPTDWPTVAAGLWGALAVQLGLMALLIVRLAAARDEPSRSRGGGIGVRNPILSSDMLLLRRRGWLLSPLVMGIMPLLALAYIRLHSALEATVWDTCSLFLWHTTAGTRDRPLDYLMPIVMGSIGAQLLLHPASLAGIRSLARDEATGRLASLWMTRVTAREVVLGRYLSVLAPFAVFFLLAGPVAFALGYHFDQLGVTIAGLVHWLALILLVPAMVLSLCIDREWKGQGLLPIVGLEGLRLLAAWRLEPLLRRADLGEDVGMVLTCGLLLAVALVMTPTLLRRAIRKLESRRAGEAP